MKQTPLLVCLNLLCIYYTIAQSPIRNCTTDELHHELLNSNPDYKLQRALIDRQLKAQPASGQFRDATIQVPVVVHVVYNTSLQNISDQQIHTQIAVLNRDFGQLLTKKYGQAGSSKIQFTLASADPTGMATTGITRTATAVTSFSSGSSIMTSSAGGKDPWPYKQYLNIWVCNLNKILGFAYMPGAHTDGVVIGYKYFGTINTNAPYHLGRTATHEVGHWLNLHHIWGITTGCHFDDYVEDTPNSSDPNWGCKPGHASCETTDMVENYMDYSDDACMNLFTKGQIARMEAMFASGGYRSSILSSIGLTVGVAFTCTDGIKNGSETAIDCGGTCAPCITCSDGIKNGSENGIDCGGSCIPCSTCSDNIQNGNETGVDCGGTCQPCACTSKGENSKFNYIQSVQINDSVFISGDNTGLLVQPLRFFTLYRNKKNGIRLDPGGVFNQGIEYWSIWVDWNQDNWYDETNEKIWKKYGTGALTDSIDLQNSFGTQVLHALDTYSVRIQMRWYGYGTACSNFDFGEVEEYSLILKEYTVSDPCQNGIKDGIEEGIDCGPGCKPCAAVIPYCLSRGKSSKYEYIQSVQFDTWVNHSGNNGGYADYSHFPIAVSNGQELTYILKPGFAGPYILTEYWNIWADWNQDQDFADAGELITTVYGTGESSGKIKIPAGAPPGQVKLRIQMRDNKKTMACEEYPYGETEDYLLDIISSSAKVNTKTPWRINLYPNPARSYFSVDLPEKPQGPVQLLVCNMSGQQFIKTDSYPLNDHILSVDCRNLPNGLYFVVVRTASWQIEKKLLIQRD